MTDRPMRPGWEPDGEHCSRYAMMECYYVHAEPRGWCIEPPMGAGVQPTEVAAQDMARELVVSDAKRMLLSHGIDVDAIIAERDELRARLGSAHVRHRHPTAAEVAAHVARYPAHEDADYGYMLAYDGAPRVWAVWAEWAGDGGIAGAGACDPDYADGDFRDKVFAEPLSDVPGTAFRFLDADGMPVEWPEVEQ